MNLRQAYELEKLTRAFFSMDVLLLGNNIWVRSYLPITALLFITQYFVSDAAQTLLNLITLPVLLFLVQKGAEHVARKRFDLQVLESCWWSVWWRATLYTIAIGLVMAIAIAVVIVPLFGDVDLESLTAEEISERDPLNTGRDSVILFILFYVIASFLAIGYATLRAFRVSCIKTRQCPQHIGIEMVLEEEERKGRGEQDIHTAIESAVAAVSSPGDDSRYVAPPKGNTLQATEVPPGGHHTLEVDEHLAGEERPSDNLRRYMPPAGTSHKGRAAADAETAQPTDLVGAAPSRSDQQKSKPTVSIPPTDLVGAAPGSPDRPLSVERLADDTAESGKDHPRDDKEA